MAAGLKRPAPDNLLGTETLLHQDFYLKCAKKEENIKNIPASHLLYVGN